MAAQPIAGNQDETPCQTLCTACYRRTIPNRVLFFEKTLSIGGTTLLAVDKPPGWSGTDSLRLGRGGQGVTSPGLSKGDHTRSGAYPAGAVDALRAVSKCSQRDDPDGSSVINPGAIASMTARMCCHCPQDTGNGPAKRNTPPPGSRMVNSKSHVVYLHAVPPANSRLTSVNSAYAEFGSAYPARASLMARYRFVV